MADAVREPGQAVVYEYRSDVIADYIRNHPEYEKVVIALSGDVGFYSGARKLLTALGGRESNVEVICGISSVVYFMSEIGLSWDDAKITSAHGKLATDFHDPAITRRYFPFLEPALQWQSWQGSL